MIAITRSHFNFSGESFYSGAAGWSESYFMSVPDYTTAATQIGQLVNARLALLCPDVSCIGATISDTAVKGDSFPSGVAIKAGTYVPAAGGQSWQPDMALRILMKAGATKRSSRWLHCVPTDCVDANGAYKGTATFTTALQNFLLLVSQDASLATKVPGAVAPPFYTLTAYTGFSTVAIDGRKLGRPFSLRRGRQLIA